MLKRENAALVVIDLQEKLLAAMYNKENLLQNARKLVEFARIADIPIIVTEQYPKGLGSTVGGVKNLIANFAPIEKLSFSATASNEFIQRIEEYSQIILTGIETHICICQTALNLADTKSVHVIADAVSSRTEKNHRIGLDRCSQGGCIVSNVEMAMYEVLKEAGTQFFKSVRHLLV